MLRPILIAVILGVLGANAYIHSSYSHYLYSMDDADYHGVPLKEIPMKIGGWECTEHTEISEDERKNGGINESLVRMYKNSSLGERSIQVLIVRGRPQHIAAHTPEICFKGAGFRVIDSELHEVTYGESNVSKFRVGNYVKLNEGLNSYQRVFWGMSVDGDWGWVSNARWHYAKSPYLFKVYFQRAIPVNTESLDQDPTNEFIKEFLPVLNQTLFDEAIQSQPENTDGEAAKVTEE